MNEELTQEMQLEEPMTYIERNGVYYQVPKWVEKELKALEIIKNKITIGYRYDAYMITKCVSFTKQEFDLVLEVLGNE